MAPLLKTRNLHQMPAADLTVTFHLPAKLHNGQKCLGNCWIHSHIITEIHTVNDRKEIFKSSRNASFTLVVKNAICNTSYSIWFIFSLQASQRPCWDCCLLAKRPLARSWKPEHPFHRMLGYPKSLHFFYGCSPVCKTWHNPSPFLHVERNDTLRCK